MHINFSQHALTLANSARSSSSAMDTATTAVKNHKALTTTIALATITAVGTAVAVYSGYVDFSFVSDFASRFQSNTEIENDLEFNNSGNMTDRLLLFKRLTEQPQSKVSYEGIKK